MDEVSAFRIHEAYLDQAWRTLKESILLKFDPTDYRRRTGNRFPSGIIPIGTWVDGRRVAMVHGVPYYVSTGTSASGKNKDEFKEKDAWYPFAGIEPDKGKWFDGAGSHEWAMKGAGVPGLNQKMNDASPQNDRGESAHHTDWGDDTSKMGRYMGRWEKHIPESYWKGHQVMNAQQINESLAANGWEAQWHQGEYPQPTPEPQPGTIQWQQKYG